jgi:drug/metabolite transporter (DMT)-like permease
MSSAAKIEKIEVTVSSEKSTVWRAYLALGAGILCVSWSAIFVKLAEVPGTVSAFYRMLIACSVLIPLWLSKSPSLPSRPAVMTTLLGGLFFALDLALWNGSILLTSATTATILANNAPLWVGLGAFFLFRQRLPIYFWLGLLVSLSGMLLVAGGRELLQHMSPSNGNVMAIVAGVFYAAYLLITERARSNMDTLSFMTLSVIASTVVLFVICLLLGSPLTGYSMQSWSALIGLGLVTHLGGWLAINYALGHIRATSVSVSLLGQSVLTAIFSILLFGEHLSGGQVAGGMLVLGGIYIVNQKR